MANIRVDSTVEVFDGQALTFRSPVDISQVTGLKVYYPKGDTTASKVFQFADAHGQNIGNLNLFASNVIVKVILDTASLLAYVQNADTNAYLEGKFTQLTNLANEKEIFKAHYGTTKSAEIEAAYQAGKFCVCVSANGKVLYTLYHRLVATQHFFFSPSAGVVACKSDVWSEDETAAQLIGSPTVAEMNAAIAAIPTPDVSGQIGAHNTSNVAHNDMRVAINAKAPMYTYGTDDLTAGSSPLESGKLYFVYE